MSRLLKSIWKEADDNFAVLAKNPDPGTILVVGLSEDGEHLVQLCTTDGNRILVEDTIAEPGRVYTNIADRSKLLDDREQELSPEERVDIRLKKKRKLLYNAMREVCFDGITYAVVSNGPQTDAFVHGIRQREKMAIDLRDWIHDETDVPLITAVVRLPDVDIGLFAIDLSVHKSREEHVSGRGLFRLTEFDFEPGLGYCIYANQADVKPFSVPLRGGQRWVLAHYFRTLDKTMAVKFIAKDGTSKILIENKFREVE